MKILSKINVRIARVLECNMCLVWAIAVIALIFEGVGLKLIMCSCSCNAQYFIAMVMLAFFLFALKKIHTLYINRNV